MTTTRLIEKPEDNAYIKITSEKGLNHISIITHNLNADNIITLNRQEAIDLRSAIEWAIQDIPSPTNEFPTVKRGR